MTEKELELLIGILCSHQFTRPHLEIGTAAGGTLWKMMKAYDDRVCPPFVVVDPMAYFEDQLNVVINNLTSHGVDPEKVEFRTLKSSEAFTIAKKENESYDFILVDGAHKLRYVMEDLRWSRLLHPGGIICFHDYSERFPGVHRPVTRFLQQFPNYEILDHQDSLLALRKTAPSKKKEISFLDLFSARLQTPLDQIKSGIRKRYRL